MSTTALKAPTDLYGTQLKTEYGDYDVTAAGLVTVDSRLVATLLGAGFVPVDAQQITGSHTITSDEATANAVVIDTGLDTVSGAIAQVLNAGNVATSDADITWSGGNVTVADGSTYNTVAGYVINWIAWGY